MAALRKHGLERLGLCYGAWEPVEDYSRVVGAEAVVNACQYAHHQFVGYQLAVVNVTLGCLAQLGAVLYLIAQHIAG